jgi:hypothetical protein
MITKLDSATSVDTDPGDFQMTGWTRYRQVNQRLVAGLDAWTSVSRQVSDFDLVVRGADICVSSVTVKLAIDRLKSWVVVSKQSSLLLEHEQGHYYIAYLVMVAEVCPAILKISKPAASIPGFSRLKLTDNAVRNPFTAEAQNVLNASTVRVKGINATYDLPAPYGTANGTNPSSQTTWTALFWRHLALGTPLPPGIQTAISFFTPSPIGPFVPH